MALAMEATVIGASNPSSQKKEKQSSTPNLDFDEVSTIDFDALGMEEEDRWPGALLLGLLCGCSALEGADAMLLPSTFYALQNSLGLTLNHLSSMTLVQALAMSAASPVWGVLADRGTLTRKSILVWGTAIQGVVTIALAFVNSFAVMLVLRLLNGAMLSSLRPVANGIIADVTSENLRGKAYGFIQLAMNIGMCVGALVSTPMSTQTVVGMDGWRVAYGLIGAASIAIGAFVGCLMTEPEREASPEKEEKPRGAVLQELKRLLQYFRMPTFCALVLQGCFGCVPWNALGYQTLYFQVGGLGNVGSSALQALSQSSAALGNLLGGVIGDKFAARSRLHGRPCAAQISVLAGIPIAWLIFMVTPPEHGTFWYYAALVVLLGLTATWCATGVNWPILSEIVEPDGRSSVMAWQTAFEGSCAAIFGNAAVGLLAQNVFGYDVQAARDADPSQLDPANMHALGKALMLTSFVPWIICLAFYTLLHWSYPRDLARVVRTRSRKFTESKSRASSADSVSLAEVAKKLEEEELPGTSPSRPRISAAAAAAAEEGPALAEAEGKAAPAPAGQAGPAQAA